MSAQDFLQACASGDLDAIKEMVKGDAELLNLRGTTGQSPVLTAVYHGKPQAAELLLELGIGLDVFEAAALGKEARVRELVAADETLAKAFGNDGFTALGLAAFLGHLPVAAYLLEKGAEVNSVSKNNFQVMPLHSAVANRHVAIAELLLKHGAEVNAHQQDGFTPLHEAAQNGDTAMISLLLTHGADRSITKDDGETPLQTALRHDRAQAADLLRG
ncbi:ankyrin repeat protein [Tumebacillus sp. BK434]|uniref:ankyrin repeat domain-containing protein n=1 Tax=Tumebacillus sp. BK434 TaxID=2512169 RepID=UPI00104F4727|nr:ankyrin repeat domain-containing protein [Tumebacillus sp. BK434]TCP57698.1 ankyrin repeat protein [Tumebacillus sp. BK434]